MHPTESFFLTAVVGEQWHCWYKVFNACSDYGFICGDGLFGAVNVLLDYAVLRFFIHLILYVSPT